MKKYQQNIETNKNEISRQTIKNTFGQRSGEKEKKETDESYTRV